MCQNDLPIIMTLGTFIIVHLRIPPCTAHFLPKQEQCSGNCVGLFLWKWFADRHWKDWGTTVVKFSESPGMQGSQDLTFPSSWHSSELQISDGPARLLGKLLPLRQSSHDQASYWQWFLTGVNSWTMPWQCLGELQRPWAKALQGLWTV